MKPYVQFLLTLAIMIPVVTLADLAGVPFLVTVVVFFLASNQLIFLYNSRASLKLWPIPERGYDRRREAMEAEEHLIFNLGFQKTDEFYLKTISDAVVYVYKHRSEPIELCLYHLSINRACDFITRFEGDITVTTATSKSAGAVKRPHKRLLQIFPGENYGVLLERHRQAVAFLSHHGIRPLNSPASAFRAHFVNAMQEFYNRGRSERLFLLRFFGSLLMASGQNYRRPLASQYPSGLTLDVLTG